MSYVTQSMQKLLKVRESRGVGGIVCVFPKSLGCIFAEAQASDNTCLPKPSASQLCLSAMGSPVQLKTQREQETRSTCPPDLVS